jgi:hypothetical protein
MGESCWYFQGRFWASGEESKREGGEPRVWVNRTKDLFAAFIVGNGVLDLIAPCERYSLWSLARASASRR